MYHRTPTSGDRRNADTIPPRRGEFRLSFGRTRRLDLRTRLFIRCSYITVQDDLISRRLGRLGDAHEAAQDACRALEAVGGALPIGEENDLHGGTHARGRSLVADEGDERLEMRERVVAERDHRALRPRLDLS